MLHTRFRTDFPTKDEKIKMAHSIVTAYPILRSETALGYVS